MEKSPFLKYNAISTKGGNVVWGAAMQLAWNELKEKFAKNNPLEFETNNQQSLTIIQNFNSGCFKQSDLDDNSVYVKSGYGQDTLDTINAEVKKKFPNKTTPPIEGPLHDSDIISYAYLFKQILFDVKFKRREHAQFEFNGQQVDSFYASEKEQKKQIKVHQYQDQHSFMVEIRGKDSKDSLFLIKNKDVSTVDDALKHTSEGSNKNGEFLGSDDRFQMPVVNLDIKRNFKEMQGLKFKNEELSKYAIRVMFEAIKLNIDESGAKVENEAVVIASRSMKINMNRKTIVLDRSFWVVMKEQGKNPYLCVFINDPKESV